MNNLSKHQYEQQYDSDYDSGAYHETYEETLPSCCIKNGKGSYIIPLISFKYPSKEEFFMNEIEEKELYSEILTFKGLEKLKRSIS